MRWHEEFKWSAYPLMGTLQMVLFRSRLILSVAAPSPWSGGAVRMHWKMCKNEEHQTLFFRWEISVILFCWDTSVICLTVVSELAVKMFISLYFQTFWPKWPNFFRSFQKHFGPWPKKTRYQQLCADKFDAFLTRRNSEGNVEVKYAFRMRKKITDLVQVSLTEPHSILS